MASKKIVAIGELLIDGLSSSTVSDLSHATGLNIHPGGSPGNFCRYLKRCGADATLVATVGDDGFGKILLEKIAEDGIDTTNIHVTEGAATSFIAVARTSGTPDFIPYRGADTFIEKIDPELIRSAGLLHTTAFALSKNPAQQSILSAFKSASEQNILVSIDWNYAEPVWGKRNNAKDVFETLQKYAPLFKFSLDDIERFLGKTCSIDEAKAFLDTVNAQVICLTCGSDGVYYRSDENLDWTFIPAEKIEVKNATGAGDSFWAGFVSGYINGLSLDASVRRGIQVASYKLQGNWDAVAAMI